MENKNCVKQKSNFIPIDRHKNTKLDFVFYVGSYAKHISSLDRNNCFGELEAILSRRAL